MNKNINFFFNDDDYISNDGMITYIWGPAFWHILHTISFNYPVNPTLKNKIYHYKFIKNLKNILPCKYCRDNLKKNFKIFPLTIDVFKNRYNFSKYIFDLHELINHMLNKKSNLTYELVRDRYELFRSRCIDNNNNEIEKGCIEPLYEGVKSKCILSIIPRNDNQTSFNIDNKCLLKKKIKY